MQNQDYRVRLKLRRRNEADSIENIEFKSEDHETYEDFCLAIASELLERIQEDLEYLEGNDEANINSGLQEFN